MLPCFLVRQMTPQTGGLERETEGWRERGDNEREGEPQRNDSKILEAFTPLSAVTSMKDGLTFYFRAY